MKRSAFTLVELIFVIVIIGILAAVAIPQFKNLKQNAEVKAVIKTTIDTASGAATAAVNIIDLEDGNASNIHLNSLVDVKGKGWTYTSLAGAGTYTYKDAGLTVATIDFNGSGRTVTYTIDCSKFKDTISQGKCYTETDSNASTPVNKTITF